MPSSFLLPREERRTQVGPCYPPPPEDVNATLAFIKAKHCQFRSKACRLCEYSLLISPMVCAPHELAILSYFILTQYSNGGLSP